MDDRFTAAVKAAFDLGLESRAAAAATYAMSGKQRAEEIAIELAWRYLLPTWTRALMFRLWRFWLIVAIGSRCGAFREALESFQAAGGLSGSPGVRISRCGGRALL